MRQCLRCRITGRVQGVWFRASTQQQAELLGLDGFAQNLADGRVEVVVCGNEAALGALRDWLGQGPELARVDQLQCELVEQSIPKGFTIL